MDISVENNIIRLTGDILILNYIRNIFEKGEPFNYIKDKRNSIANITNIDTSDKKTANEIKMIHGDLKREEIYVEFSTIYKELYIHFEYSWECTVDIIKYLSTLFPSIVIELSSYTINGIYRNLSFLDGSILNLNHGRFK